MSPDSQNTKPNNFHWISHATCWRFSHQQLVNLLLNWLNWLKSRLFQYVEAPLRNHFSSICKWHLSVKYLWKDFPTPFCRQNNLDLFIWSLFRALLRFFANRFVKFSLSDWNIFLEFVFLEAENWRMRWWWANIIGFSSFSLKFHENFIEKRIKHEETFRKSLKNVNFDDLWVKLKSLGKDFYVEIALTWFLEVKRVEDLFIMHRFSQYRCQSLLRAAPLPSKYF